MQRRPLGKLEVSVVGLGGNTFGSTYFANAIDASGTRAVVDAALDAGINFIDTANSYGDSEEFLGRALEGRRDQVVLATKFGSRGGASAAAIREAVDNSLRRLRTDHIDLYQLHRPDANVPIDETLSALDQLVKAGKVIEIGCSNFSVEQLDEAAAASAAKELARFASVQNELSILRSRATTDVLPACKRLDMAFIPYSPLVGGLLTGKYRRGEPPAADTRLASFSAEQVERSLSDRNFDRVDRLEAFASERGHSLIELAFGWLLAQPQVVSVIAGATRPDQVRSNAAAAGWALTADEAAEATAQVEARS
ncbi:MAG: aldo/keto reductase [Acidimicrobiaceae bacterium]|nr:aldo/keto reductase [Acidimicrobiaceae bacterium]